MMKPAPRFPYLSIALTATALAGGCGTQEIDADRLLLPSQPSEAYPTSLTITLALEYPTLEQEQAVTARGLSAPSYTIRIDGRAVVFADAPLVLFHRNSTAFLAPAGSHVVELVERDGHSAFRSDPLTIDADHTYHLVAFGGEHALQSRLITYDLDIPAATMRYAVLNLAQGESLEVVDCPTTEQMNCTPIGAPVAYGEVAQGEAPLDPALIMYSTRWSTHFSYRRVPTASAPNPRPGTLPIELAAGTGFRVRGGDPVLQFFAAPTFFSANTGNVLEEL